MQTFFIWLVIFLLIALFGVWQIGEINLSMPAVSAPAFDLAELASLPRPVLAVGACFLIYLGVRMFKGMARR